MIDILNPAAANHAETVAEGTRVFGRFGLLGSRRIEGTVTGRTEGDWGTFVSIDGDDGLKYSTQVIGDDQPQSDRIGWYLA